MRNKGITQSNAPGELAIRTKILDCEWVQLVHDTPVCVFLTSVYSLSTHIH